MLIGSGIGIGFGGRIPAPAPDPLLIMNAVNIFGPGHSTGGSLAVSAGTPINFCFNATNYSGVDMVAPKLNFAGFHMRNPTAGSSPWVAVGNDTPLTAKIAYPQGSQFTIDNTPAPTTSSVSTNATQANGFFDNGTLYWLSGANAGTINAPGTFTYLNSGGTFNFSPALASAPANGDRFMVFAAGTEFTDITQSASTSLSIPNDDVMQTDGNTLPTAIPHDTGFTVIMRATPSAGQNYITTSLTTPLHPGLGLFGVCVEELQSVLPNVCSQIHGDSIATNNGAFGHAVCNYLNIPSMQISISGFRIKHLGQSSGIYFQKIVDMALLNGSTHIFNNSGTNDLNVDANATTTVGWHTVCKDMAEAEGVEYVPATLLPAANMVTVTASALVRVGTTLTATVPDATKFVVGRTYNITGATPSNYNGVKFCTGRDTGLNTVDFLVDNSGTTPATGTITIRPGNTSATDARTSRELLTPATGYEAGGASLRGLYNAGIRAPGAFSSYLELGDAFELVRDDGICAVGGDKPWLEAPFGLITVTSVINTTRFLASAYANQPNAAAGSIQCVSATNAANVGITKSITQSTSSDITVSSAFPAAFTVGDTFYLTTGSMRSINDSDNLHPQAAVGTIGTTSGSNKYHGGQAGMTYTLIDYLTPRL